MSISVDDIKNKITNLEAEMKKHSNYVTEITQGIEKLMADKATSLNNINILNGALQAYRDVVSGSTVANNATVQDGPAVLEGQVE